MKRWFSILMAAILLLGMTACRSGQEPAGANDTNTESSESSESEAPDTQTAQTGTEHAAPSVRTPHVQPTAASYSEIYERFKSMENGWMFGNDEMAVEEEAVAEAEAPAAAEPTEDMELNDAGAVRYGEKGSGLEYSGTNVQVQGIDEGDIIKTDGRFIYALHDYEVVYIFSVDGAQVEKVGTINLSKDKAESWEWTSEIFIAGDRLAVISNTDGWVYYENDKGDIEDSMSENRETSRIRVYDITDRTAPKLLTVLEQNGNYRSARLIDDRLYMVSDYGIYYSIVEDEPITYIPRYFVNGKATLLEPGQIICPEDEESRAYTVVGVFDLTKGEVLQCQSYLGYTDTIYMNQNSLYLANSNYKDIVIDTWEERVYTVEQHTTGVVTQVTRFDVGEDGLLNYIADGEVPGSIYGQFALDEADGFLRIVTTGSPNQNYKLYIDPELGFENRRWENEFYWSNDEQTNALYILNEKMEQVGSLTDLALGERVYSVRYNGDIAYFCTFRQMDPLFAVDVSDPTDPKELSALKIPGFSEYLHVYGEGKLFGLGQEADVSSGSAEGLKLTMFDTSDPENVSVLHTTLPKGWNSYAEYNHKAILVDPGKNLIGFDIQDEDGSRYVIYGYSEENGFELKGSIEMDYYSDARGLYIGDYYYIVSQNEISIIDLTSLELTAVVTF